MICYQDEKMYGPPVNGVTVEELEKQISKLEKKIYGDIVCEKEPDKTPKIYDVETGKLVEYVIN